MQVQFAYFLLCPGLGFRPSGALILGGKRGKAAAAAGKRWRQLRSQGSARGRARKRGKMQAPLAGSSAHIVAVGAAAIRSERRRLITTWGGGARSVLLPGRIAVQLFFLLAPSPVLALELKMAGSVASCCGGLGWGLVRRMGGREFGGLPAAFAGSDSDTAPWKGLAKGLNCDWEGG